MIRAVIDTNVLVSGLIAPTGNEALILLAVHQGLVHPCFSQDILMEYAEVLARPKFAFSAEDIAAVLTMFRSRGEMFTPENLPAVLPDPDDIKFIACAEAALAEYIVTGNKKHFPEASYGAARVVSGSEFLDRITREI